MVEIVLLVETVETEHMDEDETELLRILSVAGRQRLKGGFRGLARTGLLVCGPIRGVGKLCPEMLDVGSNFWMMGERLIPVAVAQCPPMSSRFTE